MKLLLADDQPDVLEALRLLLKAEGHEIYTVEGPGAVLAAAARQTFDVALIDLNYTRDTTSGQEGLTLLAELRKRYPELPVVVMTAWGSIDGAVSAMKQGARDYVQKPWENQRLLSVLRTQVELARALSQKQRLERENQALRRGDLPTLIAESAAMRKILQVIERIGPSDANVLITGEHGTGKDVIARWVHGQSARAPAAFVVVNTGGLSEGVVESELFGHVKGAFTDAKTDRQGCFELADGGTLFLDEIGNMPLTQQGKLLRALESGEFSPVGSSKTRKANVRVVSATNAKIADEASAGRFRQDLLYRLNTIEIELPALRERRADIPLLARHFLREHAARYALGVRHFAADALALLDAHPWPGNVRELSHAVERAVLLAPGETVVAADFALKKTGTAGAHLYDMTLEQAERVLIEQALQRFPDNMTEVARALGLSRSALYRRLAAFGFRGSP